MALVLQTLPEGLWHVMHFPFQLFSRNISSVPLQLLVCTCGSTLHRPKGNERSSSARHLMKTVGDDSEAHGGDADHGDRGHTGWMPLG